MAAPTLVQNTAPEVDLLSRVEIVREGAAPYVVCTFRPSLAPKAGAVNALGLPLHESAAEWTYALMLTSNTDKGRDRIATLMNDVATRIKAGESVDDAIANEAYDLLAEVSAYADAAAIMEATGVQVMGRDVFAERTPPAAPAA